VIAFSRTAGDALMALGDGESAALSGTLTAATWTDNAGKVRPSLSLQAHAVLTPYHVTRRRQAVDKPKDTEPRTHATAAIDDLPNDQLDF